MAATTESLDLPFSALNIRTYVPITLDLEELNYDAWRELFEATCITFDVINHLKPAASSTPSAKWTKTDSLIKLWLYATIKPSLTTMILKSESTAYDLWKSLEQLFRDNKEARAMQLDLELRSIKIGDLSISQYCQKIKSIADILANIDQQVPESHLVNYTVNGLGEKFANVGVFIRHHKPPLTIVQVRSMLLFEESLANQPTSVMGTHRDNSSTPIALYTGNGDHRTDSERQNNDRNDTRNDNRRRNNDNRNDRRGSGDRRNDDRRNSDQRGGDDRRNNDRRQHNDRRNQQSSPAAFSPWQWSSPPSWAPPPHWLPQYTPWGPYPVQQPNRNGGLPRGTQQPNMTGSAFLSG